MITVAYIGYRLPGRTESKATYGVRAKTEGEAFEQAVEALKLDLLLQAARPDDDPHPIHLRGKFGAILRLRPWAIAYTHALEAEPLEVPPVTA